MKMGTLLLPALVMLASAAVPETAEAQSGYSSYGSPRQYYSAWAKHPTKNYHYRRLYYKPNQSYVGYKHQYVIYYPARPKHCYFYNPYKKTYWGRCEIQHGGKYSMLPPEHRKPTVPEIPESAFPPPSDTPILPEALDGLRLDLPPDDLPFS